jgi:hypothetical protein
MFSENKSFWIIPGICRMRVTRGRGGQPGRRCTEKKSEIFRNLRYVHNFSDAFRCVGPQGRKMLRSRWNDLFRIEWFVLLKRRKLVAPNHQDVPALKIWNDHVQRAAFISRCKPIARESLALRAFTYHATCRLRPHVSIVMLTCSQS